MRGDARWLSTWVCDAGMSALLTQWDTQMENVVTLRHHTSSSLTRLCPEDIVSAWREISSEYMDVATKGNSPEAQAYLAQLQATVARIIRLLNLLTAMLRDLQWSKDMPRVSVDEKGMPYLDIENGVWSLWEEVGQIAAETRRKE